MPTTINKLGNSQIEIKGSLPAEALAKFRTKALTHINEHVNIDGFRKGHVPEDMLVKQVGEVAILEECAEYALAEEYPNILKENNIDAIGRPEIIITKIAKDIPLEFTIKTAVMPEVTLPDYKDLASKIPNEKPVEITEEKIEATILEILKSRAKQNEAQNETQDVSETSDENENTETQKSEPELPELNDELVKSLGKFENVAEFRAKLKENMTEEAKHASAEKHRLAIVEAILKDTKAEIPEIMIESELDTMLHRFQGDISNMGFQFEDYLKHINKDEVAIRAEWRKDAEKRIMLQLAVAEIAKKENLIPSDEEIEKEVAHILEHYEHADPAHARQYVVPVLTNEKVFAFLEKK